MAWPAARSAEARLRHCRRVEWFGFYVVAHTRLQSSRVPAQRLDSGLTALCHACAGAQACARGNMPQQGWWQQPGANLPTLPMQQHSQLLGAAGGQRPILAVPEWHPGRPSNGITGGAMATISQGSSPATPSSMPIMQSSPRPPPSCTEAEKDLYEGSAPHAARSYLSRHMRVCSLQERVAPTCWQDW